jgi:hypothetical protein
LVGSKGYEALSELGMLGNDEPTEWKESSL